MKVLISEYLVLWILNNFFKIYLHGKNLKDCLLIFLFYENLTIYKGKTLTSSLSGLLLFACAHPNPMTYKSSLLEYKNKNNTSCMAASKSNNYLASFVFQQRLIISVIWKGSSSLRRSGLNQVIKPVFNFHKILRRLYNKRYFSRVMWNDSILLIYY